MASKQTRRSISVSMVVHDRLKARCDADGLTCSGVVEGLLRKFFEMPDRVARVAKPKLRRGVASRVVADLVTVLPARAVERGPVDRVQVIKDAAAGHAAYGRRVEPEVKKKEGSLPSDAASKIFTF